MSKHTTSAAWTAALSTSVAIWPVCMGMGAFAYAALGVQHQAQGFAAGLLGAAVCALTLAALGFRGAGVHVPRSVTGVFVTALVAALPAMGLQPAQALAAAMLMCMLAGVLLALLGALRLGTLVRYCPHPVVAGFMNAMALLLAASQVAPVLGLPSGPTLWSGAALLSIKPLSLLVAAVTCLWILQPPKWSRALPPALAGMLAGGLLHYALQLLGAAPWLGGLMGGGALQWPPLDAGLQALQLIWREGPGRWLLEVLAWAFALAVLASIDHLLSAKAFEATTGVRRDPNADLLRLGLAQVATAGVGGVPCTISLAASQTLHHAGGRGPRAQIGMALMLVALAGFLAPVAGGVPQSVVAAMLLTVAWRLLDRPMMGLAWRWIQRRGDLGRALSADLGVSCAVVIAALWAGMLAGVAAGVLLSVVFFIAAMRHSVVRSIRGGVQAASRQLRPAADRDRLLQPADPIIVIELEGLFYFGTADHLQSCVDGLLEREGGPPSHVVLDWRRVRYVDLTGAQLVGALARSLQARGVKLWCSHLPPASVVRQTLDQAFELAGLKSEAVFEDTDRAVERAEDEVLARLRGGERHAAPEAWGVEALAPLDKLSDGQRKAVASRIEERSFRAGDVVFRQGQAGDSLFLISRGAASVYRHAGADQDSVIAVAEHSRVGLEGAESNGVGAERLATFRAGAFFGEMALLSGKPRDATVIAETDLSTWELRRSDLDELARDDPSLAGAFFEGLAGELAERLRQANRAVDSLRS